MQKFMNNPENFVEDTIEGFIKYHKDLISRTDNPRVLKSKYTPVPMKVGIVTGGGSGHLPSFIGFLGKNMVDAVAVGEIFSSPTPQSFFDAINAANSGKGVACLFGNYSGDKMNVKLAKKMAEKIGIEVQTVVANDDISSAPKNEKEKRRAGGGEVFLWKIGGAKASLGANLNEVIEASQKAVDNIRSIGVGLKPCTIPTTGKPNFNIEDGKMVIGIGHHGESGLETTELKPAKDIANILVEKILNDIEINSGEEVAVLLSGLGATPYEELYILYNEIYNILEKERINIYDSFVGNFYTSLDMAGAFLTLMKLDKELKDLLDVECNTPGLTKLKKGTY